MALEHHSVETLVSAAMVRIGEATVADINANNDRSRTAKSLYFQAKQWLLSIYPWEFALVQGVQLTRLTSAPVTRWQYEYALPSDRLGDDMRAVYSEAAVGALPIINGFAIQNKKLYTDLTTIYVDYVQDTDESAFPPYFAEVVIELLAMQFAAPVTDQTTTMTAHREVLMGTGDRPGVLAIAMNADARPGEVRTVQDAPFITARFAGSGQWLG